MAGSGGLAQALAMLKAPVGGSGENTSVDELQKLGCDAALAGVQLAEQGKSIPCTWKNCETCCQRVAHTIAEELVSAHLVKPIRVLLLWQWRRHPRRTAMAR